MGSAEMLVRAAVAIAAAAGAQWLLGRASRRLPLIAARAVGGADALARGLHLRWQRPLGRLLAIPKAAAWLAAAAFVGRQFPALDAEVRAIAGYVVAAVTRPMLFVGERSYSALDVVLLPAALGALWMAVSGLAYLVESRIGRASGGAAPEAIGFLFRYVVAFFGGVLVLQLWGIDLRSLAIVASVLGVGIGFGLQHIANNFVSGVVISLERPIRPGDFVTVDGLTGVVERIGARSTEIRTTDRVKILVPNSKFLETQVVNWNHGDPVSRLHVPVTVAYGSNVPLVRSLLLEAARSHPDVLGDPRPDVDLDAFGSDGLAFDLEVWTRDPSRQGHLVSELNYRIDAAFRRQGIEIPYPQRDLRLRSPELERALALWARWLEREGAALDVAAARPEAPEAADSGRSSSTELAVEEEQIASQIGPRRWSRHELVALAARMRGPGGVAIADRRHRQRTYARCFLGSEAVDWLVAQEGLRRADAVRLGQRLVDDGLVHHVLDEHPFHDGHFFYRFRADDAAAEDGVSATEGDGPPAPSA